MLTYLLTISGWPGKVLTLLCNKSQIKLSTEEDTEEGDRLWPWLRTRRNVKKKMSMFRFIRLIWNTMGRCILSC